MIQGIQTLQNASIGLNKIENKDTRLTSDVSFSDSLEAAKSLIEATNEAEQTTKQLTYDFLTGKNDNVHSLQIAQEQSSILLSFTLQVRNQLLDSYREIMRLNV